MNKLPHVRNSAGLLAVSLMAVAVAPQSAMAATDTATLDVSATVTSNCDVSTTALAFGNVDVTSGSDTDGTGGISVTCTSGTAWTATADVGAGIDATLISRKMTDGTNLLNYSLYTDDTYDTVWGDGAGGTTGTITGTGDGSAQDTTIYGRVPLGQTTLPAGDYSDTVTVTVTYT